MKAPSPAFSLYPKDILSDEACSAMTDEELGVYVRLLCHAWLEGSIPADRVRLARLTRRSLPRFGRVWRAVGPCWDADPEDPERLVQRRMERERTKQVDYSELQSRRAQSRETTRGVSPNVSTKRLSRGSAGRQPDASRIEAGSSLPSPSPSPRSTNPSLTLPVGEGTHGNGNGRRPGGRAVRADETDRLLRIWIRLTPEHLRQSIPLDARDRIRKELREGRPFWQVAASIAEMVRGALMEAGEIDSRASWPPEGFHALGDAEPEILER